MPQLVAAVFPAVGTWFAGLTAVEAALVQLGGSLLLSAASKALMPKPDLGLRGRTVTSRQPVMPRDVVYGQVRKGGVIVYMDVGGATSEYLDLVIVAATHQIQGFGAIYFNGQMAFAAGSGIAVGQYYGFAEIEQRLGDVNQPSLTVLTNNSGGKWTTNHRLRGCAHLWIRLKYDPNVYPSGIPNITFDLLGKVDVYDPRTGLQGFSENPALCLADYMANATFGVGAAIGAADGLDVGTLIAAANICDEVVAKVGGGTERRYSCGGVVTLDQSPKTIIEAMLTAMGGTCGWQSGQWQLFAGAYRTPTITLTDDDIAGGGFQLTTRVSQAENFNAVRGQFISPENDWQPDDFPAYESSTYLAEDGGERKYGDITLPFTTSASMAQRLAKIRLERQRRQMTLALTGKLSAWRVVVGDTVNVTYARWGFVSKPFEVQSVGLAISGDGDTPTLVPSLSLRETSPLVYSWTSSEAQIYAAAPRTTLPSATNVPPPSAIGVSEQLYQTLNGSGVKVLARIGWVASPSAFVTQYQVEARTGAGPWLLVGRTDQLTLDYLDIAPAIWEFRVKGITQIGVSSSYDTVMQEIFGLAAPPAALTNVTLQTAGGSAILKWTLHPDLDVRVGGKVVIRHSSATVATWSNSVSMDVVSGAMAIAVVPFKPGTYLLRVEDSSGTAGPIVQISTNGVQALAFVPVTTLTEDTTFTGTKSGTLAASGALSLDSSSFMDSWASFDAILDVDFEGGILPTGSYTFAAGMDFGALELIRLRSEIDLSVVDIATTIDARPLDADSWLSFDGADGSEVDVVVEVQTSSTSPGGSPVWSAWSRVDSTEVQAWGVRARAILSSKDSNFTPSVTKLRLVADKVL